MKLHESAHAPNPRRVRIFIAEKGIEVPRVQVDIGKRENRGPAFLALNPLGGVPVLELDDGRTIAESVAICRYFEEVHPEPPLMGVGPEDCAIVEMWNRRMELEVMRRITDAFRHTHEFFKGRITQVPEYGETRQREVPEQLVWLDEVLADLRTYRELGVGHVALWPAAREPDLDAYLGQMERMAGEIVAALAPAAAAVAHLALPPKAQAQASDAVYDTTLYEGMRYRNIGPHRGGRGASRERGHGGYPQGRDRG